MSLANNTIASELARRWLRLGQATSDEDQENAPWPQWCAEKVAEEPAKRQAKKAAPLLRLRVVGALSGEVLAEVSVPPRATVLKL